MEKKSFASIQTWIPQILSVIKKEIKKDHLESDRQFYKAHFGTKPLNKLTFEEITSAYERELLAGNEALAEWVINAWVFKHGDIYRHFAERLSLINPEFSELESLTEEQEQQVLAGATEAFGATTVYLFSWLNGVVFSEKTFAQLAQAAREETEAKKLREEEKSAHDSHEQIILRLQQEKNRLQEKYEDKLSGVQRKYVADVEALKKQIRSLQQQLLHARK